jgi:hypothetical protein
MAIPKIPDGGQPPQTLRDKIYTSTPVVLTVIATVLAGMSSSEMTRAQYFRAMAAQNQAKAADQWGYYQAKRLRATEALNTLDILAATAHPGRLDQQAVASASQMLLQELTASAAIAQAAGGDRVKQLLERATAANQQLLAMLKDPASAIAFEPLLKKVPVMEDKPVADPRISEAMQAIDALQTEPQMTPLLRQITDESLQQAFLAADSNGKMFDDAVKPAGSALDKLHALLEEEGEIASEFAAASPSTGPSDAAATALNGAARQVNAAQAAIAAERLRFAAARYDHEAKYNQVSGQLYEVLVRQSSVLSERNRARSAQLFYGMLAAQAGVVISSLSLAVQKRNVFWSLAALAGTVAIGFSGYIYFFT